MEDERNYTKVTTLDNSFEADLATQALDRAAIPYIVRPYRDTAYDGIFIPQKGWGALLVPEDAADRAKDVIALLRQDIANSHKKRGDHEDLP